MILRWLTDPTFLDVAGGLLCLLVGGILLSVTSPRRPDPPDEGDA